jgi:hypothetical protein
MLLSQEKMNYLGLVYKTKSIGSYVTTRSDALTPISTHSYFNVAREEFTTLKDPFMMEAFEACPSGYDFRRTEGWSRSYYSRTAHIAAIGKFAKANRSYKPLDTSMADVDIYCQQYFDRLPRVRSLDFATQLYEVPFEPDSSPGIGMTGRKGDEGNLPRAIAQANATIHNCLRDNTMQVIEDSTPDAAFTRTQLTLLSEGLKVRQVFGQAFQYILIEGCTAYPLMSMFKDEDSFFFCGLEPRIHVPILLERIQKTSERLISIDWSSFDSTIEPWEIQDAFDLLESILEFPNTISRAAFEFSRIFFINRKIASPDRIIYFKQRGVPSGSYYTMLIDSIVNWRRILYLHHRLTGEFPKHLHTQGDDSVFGVKRTVTPEGLFLNIPSDTDWTLNPEKCPYGESGSTVPFLQRRLRFGDHSRDLHRIERLAIFPEYEVESGEISSYRARALWEDSNYESTILCWATQYLESKFGRPTTVPRRFLRFEGQILR